MKTYAFVEIGTSNFDVLSWDYSPYVRGISVEPIPDYLDQLPASPGRVKVQAAVTHQRIADHIDIYYVPESVIEKERLPDWLKGCNSVGDYHPSHVELGVEDHVRVARVPLLNVSELFAQHDVGWVGFLKVDTEGHDCTIMRGVLSLLQSRRSSLWPEKIQFEANDLNDPGEVDEIVQAFASMGYLVQRDAFNVLLRYRTRSNSSSMS